MATRTKRLAHGNVTVAGAFVTVYTCPAGIRTIIKDVRLVSVATAPGVVAAAISSGGTGVIVLWDAAAATDKVETLTGFLVLEAGDTFDVAVGSVAGGVTGYHVSGAELVA